MTSEQIGIKLRALLDKDFIDRLKEVVKLKAWDVDFTETAELVEQLYLLMEIPVPDDVHVTYDADDDKIDFEDD